MENGKSNDTLLFGHGFHFRYINLIFKKKRKKSLKTIIFLKGLLRLEKHERHPSSDKRSDIIRAFLWPALLQNSRCVFKAVVAT